MESNWKGIKEAITSTCHEVLGHKKHHHKEWITVDTLNEIQERRNEKAAINTSRTRAEKAKAQGEYTEVNRQVNRSIRADNYISYNHFIDRRPAICVNRSDRNNKVTKIMCKSMFM
ncbi:unnamed protein product [Schistosoma curassoni]|uniref:Reverse transcriptase domain-containing protein n=1 Tax=Schistosoma curassoni TaxID=6186 RepID=A0A183KSG9_9TREM|nr:unnamed protein product [Schistosoma curassoni]